MNSVILQLSEKYVRWLLLAFALIALFRGHNLPGGGFIGGLLAGLSIVFKGFAYTPGLAQATLKWDPQHLIGSGLLLIFLSFSLSIGMGKPFMQGFWYTLAIPWFGDLKLGTPFLFDIGVFVAVIGITLMFLFSLNKQTPWK